MEKYLKTFNTDKDGKITLFAAAGGETLTIADYKIAPFLYCLTHAAVKKDSGYEPSASVKAFVDLFLAKSASKGMLEVAGGWALKEILDKKL